LIIIVILLPFSKVAKPNLPPPALINNNPISYKINNITVKTTLPSPPPQIALIQGDTPLTSSDRATNIAQKYNLNQTSSAPDVWLNTNQDTSLVYFDDTHQIQYTHSLSPAEINSQPLDKNQAIKTAQEFLTNLGFGKFKPNLPYISFTAYSLEPSQTVSPDQANLITIPFVLDSDGYNVTVSNNDFDIATVSVGPNYQIIAAKIKPSFATFNKISNHLTINPTVALEAISKNQGEIITTNTSSKIDMSAIKDFMIKDIEIEYRQSPQSALIYPYYKFSGTATFSTGLATNLTIIYPAIKTQ
jgi:hypothetical protein